MFQMRTGSQPAYPLPTCPRTCSGSTRPTTSANTGQVNTDPYSQPGMGQEHLSQPSSKGTLQTLSFKDYNLIILFRRRAPSHGHGGGHQPGDHQPTHQYHSSTCTQSGSRGDAVLPRAGVHIHLLPNQGPQHAVGVPEPDNNAHEVHPPPVHVRVWRRRRSWE